MLGVFGQAIRLLAAGDRERAGEDYRRANAIYKSIDSETGIKKTQGKLDSLA